MKIKASERVHIERLGQKWHRAYGAALLSLKLNPKLVGLDRLREDIATTATLHATNAPDRASFVFVSRIEPAFAEIVNRAFNAAVEAARKEYAAAKISA